MAPFGSIVMAGLAWVPTPARCSSARWKLGWFLELVFFGPLSTVQLISWLDFPQKNWELQLPSGFWNLTWVLFAKWEQFADSNLRNEHSLQICLRSSGYIDGPSVVDGKCRDRKFPSASWKSTRLMLSSATADRTTKIALSCSFLISWDVSKSIQKPQVNSQWNQHR